MHSNSGEYVMDVKAVAPRAPSCGMLSVDVRAVAPRAPSVVCCGIKVKGSQGFR